MSKNISIDRRIVTAAKRIDRFKGMTISRVIRDSIYFFLEKHSQCFSCQYHKEHLGTLILANQKNLLSKNDSSDPETSWVSTSNKSLVLIKEYARKGSIPLRVAVEHAARESVSRPRQCFSCPYYVEMKDAVMAKTIEDKEESA
jgi:hypothetical protein